MLHEIKSQIGCCRTKNSQGRGSFTLRCLEYDDNYSYLFCGSCLNILGHKLEEKDNSVYLKSVLKCPDCSNNVFNYDISGLGHQVYGNHTETETSGQFACKQCGKLLGELLWTGGGGWIRKKDYLKKIDNYKRMTKKKELENE